MSTPVILDTDIGSDIDDTWALAFLMRCPELDVKLVTTDRGWPEYRAKLACRILEAAGRDDVPVGLGPDWTGNTGQTKQVPCAEGYALSDYAGEVAEDGVQTMIDTIMDSSEETTVIGIGPLPTLAAALNKEPRITEKARYVGMQGSIRRGHKRDRDNVIAEANVVNDPIACRTVFSAPWEVTVTPLDTCGIVQLEGDQHRRVAESADPLAKAVMSDYATWWSRTETAVKEPDLWTRQSTILFDTVAIYLAFSESLLELEPLPVYVADDGFTQIREGSKVIRCATAWKDLPAFENLLVDRLTGNEEGGRT